VLAVADHIRMKMEARGLSHKIPIVVKLELLGLEKLPINSLSEPRWVATGHYIFPLTHT
jgi:hypothetical protein